MLHGLVTPEPVTPVQPALWRYDEMRPYIERAGKLITAAEAERRVLVLENPGLRASPAITHSLYAGLQLILPGEVARAHRHAASALRFILEGHGAYTAVDGERTYMQPGDFVITPSWTFHDHGNTTDTPMVWLDGLDVPLVNLLDTSFQERTASETQEETRQPGDSMARFGAGLMPVDWKPKTRTSPVFTYPVGAHARRARNDEARAGMGPVPRAQAQIHQPGHGRARDADHRHLHAATAEGVSRPRPIARPTAPSMSASRATA